MTTSELAITDDTLVEWYNRIDKSKIKNQSLYKSTISNYEGEVLVLDCTSVYNMINNNYSENYDTIAIVDNSFCEIAERNDAVRCILNSKFHLSENGCLILEVVLPISKIANCRDKYWHISRDLKNEEKHERFVYSYYDEFDPINQLITTHSKYELYHDSELIGQRIESVNTHWYGAEELKLLLNNAGFSNVSYQSTIDEESSDVSFLFVGKV